MIDAVDLPPAGTQADAGSQIAGWPRPGACLAQQRVKDIPAGELVQVVVVKPRLVCQSDCSRHVHPGRECRPGRGACHGCVARSLTR